MTDELKSELSGDFEELILALMMTRTEYDAHCLHEAMEGMGTNEAALIGIITTRNAKVRDKIGDATPVKANGNMVNASLVKRGQWRT